jgi:hypothetical protein
MANVQLLDEKQLKDTLATEGVEVFRYHLNHIGYTLILGVGALMLAAAGYVWWSSALAEPLWQAVFAGLIGGGLLLSIHAAYWYTFANTRFVGVSDDKLIIGRHRKAWMIDWQVLDTQTLGFDQMNATAVRGALDIDVGGQQLKLHLYNAYVFLDDIQAFMYSLLRQLQQDEDVDVDAAADEDAAS